MDWLTKIGGLVDPNQRGSANQILPGLWLGNMGSSQDRRFLTKNNITVIVNASKHLPNKFKGDIKYYRLAVNDPQVPKSLSDPDVFKMSAELPEIVKFIHKQRSEGKNVLVHCHAGIQRSSTIVAAYLMKYVIICIQPNCVSPKCKYNAAVSHIIKHRPQAFYGGERLNFHAALKKFANL